MKRGFAIDYRHGPFVTQQGRNGALSELSAGRGCACLNCQNLGTDAPRDLPEGYLLIRHDDAFWIAWPKGDPWKKAN